MIKSVLASLVGLPSDLSVLDTAAQVAERFDAHVDCLHVTFDIGTDADIAAFGPRALEQLRMFQRQARERSTNARAAFEEMRSRRGLAVAESGGPAAAHASIAYTEITGVDFDDTIREARLHDLTIVARDSRNELFWADRAGAILLGAGRPILIPPRKPPHTVATHVVVAWKDTREASCALASSMPFLQKAKAIDILAVDEDNRRAEVADSVERVAAQLRRHGLAAKGRSLDRSSKPAAETLLDEAYRLDADLLVMGGYGHSRLREFAFGGVTRRVFESCEIPVLLAH